MATKGYTFKGISNTYNVFNYVLDSYVPVLTLVGGAGNTVPVYTTNSGRYFRIGKMVFVDVLFTGDGGDEGAGTGIVNISLPLTAGASNAAGLIIVGTYLNNTTSNYLYGTIAGSATVISAMAKVSGATPALADFTGDDQNNATRTIRLKFCYEV